MTKKLNFKKIKIISFKDVISILLIFIILFSLTSVFARRNPIVYVSLNNKKVTTRNLAMFASIAYADLENINKYNITMDTNINNLTFKNTPMVTDNQLSSIYVNTKLIDTQFVDISLSSEKENTYSYLFYGLASTKEVNDWKIVNYTKLETTTANDAAEFTAMTFKRNNDIVIAYRGTDVDDINEWGQDFLYGLVEYAGQEDVAQKYAKSVARKYKNYNIYVTGHSLGGYLAQIGGAALVDDSNYKNSVKEIGYFNGIGLKFWSNILSRMPKSAQKQFDNIDELLKDNSVLNRTQDKAKKALKEYKKSGGKIVSYHINGDLIASLGTHIGTAKGFDAHPICINHHNGNKSGGLINKSLSLVTSFINPLLNNNIDKYVEQYKTESITDYIWITHETDSFFGVLPYEDNSLPPNITVKISTPANIKRNKTSTATLTVTTTGGYLMRSNLKISDFTVSNNNRLKITTVTKTKTQNTSTGTKYVYTLKLKGGKYLGNSTITLKPNTLKLVITNKSAASLFRITSNNLLISNSIKTNLF